MSGAPSAPSWLNTVTGMVLIEYVFGAMAAFMFANPRPRGERLGERTILRIPPWRRAVFASMLPVPLAIGSAVEIVRGEVLFSTYAGVVVVIAITLAVTRERIAFSAEGVERLAGFGRHHRMAWNDVRALAVWPAAIHLIDDKGRAIAVMGLLLDGYPEFVAAVLERAPADLLSPLHPNLRQTLTAIAELADPKRPSALGQT